MFHWSLRYSQGYHDGGIMSMIIWAEPGLHFGSWIVWWVVDGFKDAGSGPATKISVYIYIHICTWYLYPQKAPLKIATGIFWLFDKGQGVWYWNRVVNRNLEDLRWLWWEIRILLGKHFHNITQKWSSDTSTMNSACWTLLNYEKIDLDVCSTWATRSKLWCKKWTIFKLNLTIKLGTIVCQLLETFRQWLTNGWPVGGEPPCEICRLNWPNYQLAKQQGTIDHRWLIKWAFWDSPFCLLRCW